MNAALCEINGGLVLAVADDPGMHSSQNEQDSRFYADFAGIPCLEPATQQECYDMTRAAFEISEAYHIPVMIRLVTRLSHSRSQVKPAPAQKQNALQVKRNPAKWILAPGTSPALQKELLEKNKTLREASQTTQFNRIDDQNADNRIVIVASGVGYNYAREACRLLDVIVPVCKIGCYPFSPQRITAACKKFDTVLVIEDGYPFIERDMCHLLPEGKKIEGKLSGRIPATGELNPGLIARALAHLSGKTWEEPQPPDLPLSLPKRPPSFCQGCSHRDIYTALQEALQQVEAPAVFGDIGCYTLGYLPPFSLIETVVNMGASISMAKGAADAGLKHAVAIIGDSTFLHTGMNSLLAAAASNSPITVIICNNSTTGMTGGQPLHADGEKLKNLVTALGVEPGHVRSLTALPKTVPEMKNIIAEELAYTGTSVCIFSRECIQTMKRKHT